MTIDLGGRTVRLDRAYLDGRTQRGDPTVLHGYAITGHLAQGLTVRRDLRAGHRRRVPGVGLHGTVARPRGEPALRGGSAGQRARRDRTADPASERIRSSTWPAAFSAAARSHGPRRRARQRSRATAGRSLRAERDQLSALVDNAPYRRYERQLDAIERARGMERHVAVRPRFSRKRHARHAPARDSGNGRPRCGNARTGARRGSVPCQRGDAIRARARGVGRRAPRARAPRRWTRRRVSDDRRRPEAPDRCSVGRRCTRMEASSGPRHLARRDAPSAQPGATSSALSAARARQASQRAVAEPRPQSDPRRRRLPYTRMADRRALTTTCGAARVR